MTFRVFRFISHGLRSLLLTLWWFKQNARFGTRLTRFSRVKQILERCFIIFKAEYFSRTFHKVVNIHLAFLKVITAAFG